MRGYNASADTLIKNRQTKTSQKYCAIKPNTCPPYKQWAPLCLQLYLAQNGTRCVFGVDSQLPAGEPPNMLELPATA